MSKKIIIFGLLYWISFGVLFFYSRELRFKAEKYKKTLITLFVILYPIFCFGDQRYRFPFEKVLFPYIEYHIDIIKNKKILNNRRNFVFHDIKSYIDKNEPELYIIVIGESSNRNHMSIYSNGLKTTPYFDSIKGELQIFDKIKSKYCSTLKAIKHIFLFNEKFENGDIITLFKQAGFKTFWISNQYALENNENITSIMATLADVKVFINKAHYRPKLASNYDESVVNYLRKVVLDKAKKKVVFIHLFGSHFPYAKRYPKNFDVFKSEKLDKRSREIAEYNNSILYTDYVLFKILNVIKNQDTNSYMLYFSDHAEDITDDPKSPHAHSDDIRTEEMFNIPFVVWLSPKYKSLNNDFMKWWNIHAECCPVDILHSIIDLSRISCKEYNKSKSIFSMK
jgi:heptose-I-phosphate ethanolaminephosphotransferase